MATIRHCRALKLLPEAPKLGRSCLANWDKFVLVISSLMGLKLDMFLGSNLQKLPRHVEPIYEPMFFPALCFFQEKITVNLTYLTCKMTNLNNPSHQTTVAITVPRLRCELAEGCGQQGIGHGLGARNLYFESSK